MTRASHSSLLLPRFDSLRLAGGVDSNPRPGVRFRNVAADTRTAAMEAASQRAFVLLVLGLHSDEASAHGGTWHGLSMPARRDAARTA